MDLELWALWVRIFSNIVPLRGKTMMILLQRNHSDQFKISTGNSQPHFILRIHLLYSISIGVLSTCLNSSKSLGNLLQVRARYCQFMVNKYGKLWLTTYIYMQGFQVTLGEC